MRARLCPALRPLIEQQAKLGSPLEQTSDSCAGISARSREARQVDARLERHWKRVAGRQPAQWAAQSTRAPPLAIINWNWSCVRGPSSRLAGCGRRPRPRGTSELLLGAKLIDISARVGTRRAPASNANQDLASPAAVDERPTSSALTCLLAEV